MSVCSEPDHFRSRWEHSGYPWKEWQRSRSLSQGSKSFIEITALAVWAPFAAQPNNIVCYSWFLVRIVSLLKKWIGNLAAYTFKVEYFKITRNGQSSVWFSADDLRSHVISACTCWNTIVEMSSFEWHRLICVGLHAETTMAPAMSIIRLLYDLL